MHYQLIATYRNVSYPNFLFWLNDTAACKWTWRIFINLLLLCSRK